ncbi:CTD nuclear envelope phosphatase 1B-like isoform X2 [Varroa jacobsoni]|uniref:FCP1 homology domain-containing protein n=1 Tax=Varroa destructor TaxID=109461 RepID=A0A7M7MHV8_VARDE|nr:CTD nuclear envelope phosphatase 1B-like isoform X1 [Varroa destructor]XP_022693768.1 CTD nuclear envelope phosphatase 1B-like isoform X2 [Varroa jacobsoni]
MPQRTPIPQGHRHRSVMMFLKDRFDTLKADGTKSCRMAASKVAKHQHQSNSVPIAQVWRDEHPDRYVLTVKEKRTYRTRYPLTGQMLLPPKKINDERATLVLDLDETLIHSKYDPQDPLSLTVTVIPRPHVKPFLTTISNWYEVVVFTASLPFYADEILDDLDPNGEIFHHRLYRQHCSYFQGVFVKDLERLGRPMNQVILVDNFPGAYMMQPRNALPIRSFLGDPNDRELLQVRRVLKLVKDKTNVRPFLKRYQRHWTARTYLKKDTDDDESANLA